MLDACTDNNPTKTTKPSCPILKGDHFIASCTSNEEPVSAGQNYTIGTQCSLACKHSPDISELFINCRASDRWVLEGDMYLDSGQILQMMQHCKPKDSHCPDFERKIQSGIWDCKSGPNDIIEDQWNKNNSICTLRCDGKEPTIQIKCEGNKWMKVGREMIYLSTLV